MAHNFHLKPKNPLSARITMSFCIKLQSDLDVACRHISIVNDGTNSTHQSSKIACMMHVVGKHLEAGSKCK